MSEAVRGTFPEQAKRVAAVARNPAVTHSPEGASIPVSVVCDATGLGYVVSEDLFALGLDVRALVWTSHAGLAAAPNSVAKTPAFGRLLRVLQQGRLRFPESLPNRELIFAEVSGMRLEVDEASGYQRIRSGSGTSDDFASALCLAVTLAESQGSSSEPGDRPTWRI